MEEGGGGREEGEGRGEPLSHPPSPHRITHSFADRGAWVCLVRPFLPRQLAGGSQSCIVDRLKYLLVQVLSLLAVKRVAQENERISQPLDSYANRPVTLVGVLSLRGEEE